MRLNVMTRCRHVVCLFMMNLGVMCNDAHALDMDSTLREWAAAGIGERVRLADEMATAANSLQSRQTGPYLLVCLNELAADPL